MLCLLVFPLLLFAQDKPEEQKSRLSADLELGREFLFNQTLVKFLEVVTDSRCPRRVTCIWAGEAKVLLGIEVNGNYFEKEVVVSGGGAELGLSENLQMQISHLRPYPETGAGIPPEEYRLRFSAVFPEEN